MNASSEVVADGHEMGKNKNYIDLAPALSSNFISKNLLIEFR